MSQILSSPPTMVPTPAAVVATRHKRYLRNLLLDRRYQLRYLLVMVAVALAFTAALGAFVWHFLREASKVIAIRTMDPTDLEALQLQRELAHNDRLVVLGLVAFGVLLTVVLAVYSLVLTHKVAGPLFKIASHMNRISKGRLSPLTDLRRGDQLVEFFAAFRTMHEALGERAREELRTIDELIWELEGAGQKATADRLRVLKRQREVFLGSDDKPAA